MNMGHLRDRDEIANLLARYCELFDAGDYAGYAELFRYGRIIGPDGSVREGGETVLAHHEAHSIRYEDGTPRTSHVNSNLHIEVAADGQTATARSYVTVFQALDDFPLQPIYAGQYLDDLHKVDGRWWFKERRATARLWGDQRAHTVPDEPDA
jgi:hypothetical protein